MPAADEDGAVADGDVRLPKVAELVAGEIRRRIINGDVQAGDPLPNEAELTALFGVSRPTLREALRLLEADGPGDDEIEAEWLGYVALLVQVDRIVGDLSAPLPT